MQDFIYLSGVKKISWKILLSSRNKILFGVLKNNGYFQVGSYTAPFLANLFLFLYEYKRLKSIKNANYEVARKFGNIFRFIDDLIATNDANEFANDYKEIKPPENRDYFSRHSPRLLHLDVNEGQTQTHSHMIKWTPAI